MDLILISPNKLDVSFMSSKSSNNSASSTIATISSDDVNTTIATTTATSSSIESTTVLPVAVVGLVLSVSYSGAGRVYKIKINTKRWSDIKTKAKVVPGSTSVEDNVKV
jgi:hypothetical protein